MLFIFILFYLWKQCIYKVTKRKLLIRRLTIHHNIEQRVAKDCKMCVRMYNYKPLLLCVRFVYIYNCIFCILGYYVYMLFPLFLSSNSTFHSLQLIGFAPTGACGCGRRNSSIPLISYDKVSLLYILNTFLWATQSLV